MSRDFARILPLILTCACADALRPWGRDLQGARRGADEAAAAFSYRFTNVRRDELFTRARPLMGQYALAPSRLFRDTTLWTLRHSPDSSHAMYLNAALEREGYYVRTSATAPYPAALGGQRHYIRLRKLDDSAFEWITIVDHGIGTASASAVAAGVGKLLTSFEGKTSLEVRRDLAATLARSSQQFGHLFRIDSLVSVPAADGSTALTLSIAWQPDTLRRSAPSFAAWVDRYVMPADFNVALVDTKGSRFLNMIGTPGRMRIQVRAHQGRWVALTGLPRPMPDSLEIHADASVKFKVFRVGFRRLIGSFVLERGTHDRGFAMTWRQEPEWRFPLAANQLIRTPLRTPFAGRGIDLRLGVRDDLGSQTMSLRHIRLVVRESAIMRWLGSLGATAFGDYEGQTEVEENRFLRACFEALRRDVATAIP